MSGPIHVNDGSAQARAFAEEGVGAPCWFCGRHVGIDYLIAGYDTWDEQRLACLDCDRTIKALREKGWFPAPEDRAEGLDVAGRVRFALLNYNQHLDGDLSIDDINNLSSFIAARLTPDRTPTEEER